MKFIAESFRIIEEPKSPSQVGPIVVTIDTIHEYWFGLRGEIQKQYVFKSSLYTLYWSWLSNGKVLSASDSRIIDELERAHRVKEHLSKEFKE